MFSFASEARLLNYLPRGWSRALGAVSMLWITTAIGAGLAFFTQALLARELGPSQYGLFSSLATITMISPLAGFGLRNTGCKFMAWKDGQQIVGLLLLCVLFL
jgi:O-antigen/teichoic acid export membrane protein